MNLDQHTLSVIVAVLSCLLALSEALGGIKSIESNSIYQVILGVLKSALDVLKPKPPVA